MPLVNSDISSDETSDETNDIIHVVWQNPGFDFEVVTRDHIDIINASFTIDEELLSLEMTFLANISINNNFSYLLIFGNHSFYYLYGIICVTSSWRWCVCLFTIVVDTYGNLFCAI